MSGGYVERPSVVGTLKRQNRRTRALEAKPYVGRFELKVTGDAQTLTAGDGVLVMMIPEDLDGTHLVKAHAGVTTVDSADDIEIMVRNVGVGDMLSNPIRIAQGEFSSYDTVGGEGEIDVDDSQVAVGDRIAIDVDEPGTDAMGLMVMLSFA